MKRFYSKLPTIITTILLQSEGWLVGGSIQDTINEKEVRDYDIIVPSRELFQIVCNICAHFSPDIEFNTFGGIKYRMKSDEGENITIDIWCEELDHFLKSANKIEYVFNLKKNILLKNENI